MASGSGAADIPVVPAGDNWVFIAHYSAPVDGVFDITGLDLAGYSRIIVELDEVRFDLDAGATEGFLTLSFYAAGVLLGLGYYPWRHLATSSSGASTNTASTTEREIRILGGSTASFGMDEDSGASFNAEFEIHNFDSATLYKMVNHRCVWLSTAGHVITAYGAAAIETTEPLTGMLIVTNNAIITSGTVTVYGIQTADRTPDTPTPELVSLWVGALS
jgi:hypothetical protein